MIHRILVMLAVACAAALAQNVVTGIVLDPSGATVPEASVTLKCDRSGVRPPVATGIEGRFRLEEVSPGACSLEIRHEGFRTTTVAVRVPVRNGAPVRVVLPLAQFVSTVVADGNGGDELAANTAENRDAARVDISLLERLPVFDQNIVAAMSVFLDPGAQGVGGTQLVVDGMAVNNLGVTPSAIQEVRINQNPYSAEFSRPGRGRLEIITKSTTTEYHGTGNFIFRDAIFNARDTFAAERPPEQRRIFEGGITGPVGHSKTTAFLFSGERQEEDLTAIIFACGPGGEIRDTVAAPKRNTQIALRISHRFTQNHNVSWQYNDREFPSTNPAVGGVVLATAGTTIRPAEREVIFNDQLTLPPHWVNQFQILVGREREESKSASPAPKLVVQDAFTAGGAQVDLLRTENHVQLNDIVNWSSAKHLVKFGINVPDWSRRGTSDYSNFGGTYFFSGLDQFAAGRPYAFRQQQGSGHVFFWQKEFGAFVQDEYKVRVNLSITLGFRYNWQNFLNDENNLAPRLAFAWAPHKSRKTIFRGGAGIFYDRTNAGPITDVLRFDGRVLRSILLTDPAYPNPYVGGVAIAAEPSAYVRFAKGIRAPYSTQYSIGIEEQLAKRTTLALTYRGSVGAKLFQSRDVNAPLPPTYAARPDPTASGVRQIESSGRQLDHAIDITLRGDVTRRITGVAQYTLSTSHNNTGGIAWFPANQYNPTGEWSRSDFDQRQRFNLLGSFNPTKLLSFGAGIGLLSGKPYTMTTGLDPLHTGLANARPPGVGRNTLQGPGYADVDLRCSRDFFLTPSKREKGAVATVALDGFNVLNRVNYATYIGNLSSPFFGRAVSSLPARRLQFTVRVKF